MTTQMTATNNVKSLVGKMESQFEKTLPPQVPSKKFVRIAQTAISDPKIAEKINSGKFDQNSLFDACMKAAQDGLCFDGREAALLTFWSGREKTHKAQYIPMVGGLIKKARNSGDISTISAAVVYEGDQFDYWIDERGEHITYRPCQDRKNKGAPIKAFAICVLKDGGSQIAMMEEDEIMAVAEHSKNTDQYIPGKGPWFGEWWKKAAIRRLAKLMPSSSDLDRVFAHDNENYTMSEESVMPEPEQPNPTGRTKAASVILGDEDDTGEPQGETYDHCPEAEAAEESTEEDPI